MITILLKVAEIRKETTDAVTLCFKQPGLKKIKYHAGQYLTLIFKINGRRYIRPYSFSSAPGVDPFLEITVKRIPGGVISNHINDQVNVDDMVEVMVPVMGDFVFDQQLHSSDKHIVLWGVGSGITPLFSIAKFILSNKTGNKLTLVYGNRNHDSVIFAPQIKELQKKYRDIFSVWHFHTKLSVNEEHPFVVQGRINAAKVVDTLQKDENFASKSIHYICGPSGLKESVKKELYQIGVNEIDILTEEFELIKDPRDFLDIITRHVQISFDGTTSEVEVVKGKSILEAGLDSLLDLPYSCQTGQCIVCKGKIISGLVKMIGITKRPDKLLEDECLLCCSYPQSDKIVLQVVK